MTKAKCKKPKIKHDRRVYRLWFEFLKRAYQDDQIEVDVEFYKDWGDVLNVKFKDWWDQHKIDLFAEQENKPQILTGDFDSVTKDDSKLYLEIPVTKPISEVIHEIRETINPYFAAHKIGLKGTYPSTARFQITHGAKIRIPMFRMMLRCYHIKQEGMRLKDIPDKVRKRIRNLRDRQLVTKGEPTATDGVFASDEYEYRYVRRYILQANQIVKNVAKGEFPGDYPK